MTKTKSAKVVSDEQREAIITSQFLCTIVVLSKSIFLHLKRQKYTLVQTMRYHTLVSCTYYDWCFLRTLHVHLNVDIRCIQLHINLHVIECVQRVFDDSCIKSPKGRMESGCFDLKSGHFCQKIVGESNSKTDFDSMFAKCFPLLFFARCCFLPNNGRSQEFRSIFTGTKKERIP